MLCLKSSSLLGCAILLAITADVALGKYVYHAKSRRKISPHKGAAMWVEAKRHCEKEGATLASPISKELLQYMIDIITACNHTTPYFIGFSARKNAAFRSEEGILLEDVPEAYEMLEQIDTREGSCLCMDGNSIRTEPCWSRLPFICYTQETSVDDLAKIPVIKTKHDSGYKQYATGSYKLHEIYMNWTSAYWKCVAEDAYLVVINDSEEAKVVHGIMKGISVWVGLKQVGGGNQDWVAITGEPVDQLYNLWFDEHTYKHKPCAYMRYSDQRLDDWRCDDTGYFLCEKL